MNAFLTWKQILCGFGGEDWQIACEACDLTEQPQIHKRPFQRIEDVSVDDYRDYLDLIFGGDWRDEQELDEGYQEYLDTIADDEVDMRDDWYWYHTAASDEEYAVEILESFEGSNDEGAVVSIDEDVCHEVHDELVGKDTKGVLEGKYQRHRKRNCGGGWAESKTRKPGRVDNRCWKTNRQNQYYALPYEDDEDEDESNFAQAA